MLTDIFIAAPSDAEAICSATAPNQNWACLQLKGLDNIKLASLLSTLGDDENAAALEGETLLIFTASSDGPWIFALPEKLKDLLANLHASEVSSVASRWASHEELKSDGWSKEDVETLLGMLIDFSQSAIEANKPLLLWMCL